MKGEYMIHTTGSIYYVYYVAGTVLNACSTLCH